MPRSVASLTWLVPFVVLGPVGLAHCELIDGRADDDNAGTAQQPDGASAPQAAATKQPADSGTKQADDSGTKTAPDSGTKSDDSGTKQADDSGTKQAPDSGTTPPDDSGTNPADDGSSSANGDSGTTTAPDAGGAPHHPGSVECNGAPCDVSHGYFCCVTLTHTGIAESCKPPNSVCWGHEIECDEADDCTSGVCCQDFPSLGMEGSASCKSSCDAHICQ